MPPQPSLHDCTIEDLPRERLERCGRAALSDRELIALILGTGREGQSVFQLADEVLRHFDELSRPGKNAANDHVDLDLTGLRGIKGIGQAKAAQLIAAWEFCRRRIRPSGISIRNADDVVRIVTDRADHRQEHVVVLTLNGAHELICTRVITIGLLNRVYIHPREVFANAISDRAASVVLTHNHPSGNVQPSEEDRQVTKSMAEAGRILGIQLLDHIIFHRQHYFSFADQGLLPKPL